MARSIGLSLAVPLLGRTWISQLGPHTCLTPATHTGGEDRTTAVPPAEGRKEGDPMATIVIIGLVIFIAGAAVGAVLLVSWGIQREERNFSLTRRAPGQVSLGTRRVTGLYVRRRSDALPPLASREDMLV